MWLDGGLVRKPGSCLLEIPQGGERTTAGS